MWILEKRGYGYPLLKKHNTPLVAPVLGTVRGGLLEILVHVVQGVSIFFGVAVCSSCRVDVGAALFRFPFSCFVRQVSALALSHNGELIASGQVRS